MRILFFGTPLAAVPSLRALQASRHELVGACCQPDRPAHRGHRLTAPPVKLVAQELGLPVLQPESVKTAAFREEVASLRPDAFAVVAYGHILGPKLLALAPRGAFNLHFSLLPRWRGAAPVQRALLAGDAVTGVSIIRIVAELDAGPVVAREESAVRPDDTSPSLQERLADVGARLLVAALDDVETGRAVETPQDETRVTLAPPLSKDEGWLDPRRSAAELERRVRALHPWPGARLRSERGALQVVQAEAAPVPPASFWPGTSERAEPARLAPGTVLVPDGDALPVTCGEGVLRLLRVKPEGKGEMSGRSLVNGRLLAPGDVLLPPPETAP